MTNQIASDPKFINLSKVNDSITGMYSGISKGKDLFFLLLKNSKEMQAMSISEGLKKILKIANSENQLKPGVEIKIELIELINSSNSDKNAYKKYRLTLGNGNVYLDSLTILNEIETNNFFNLE